MDTSAPDLASIDCPHCGAELQRPEHGHDGRILCLNCGKRFAPAGAPETTSVRSPAEAIGKRALNAPLSYTYLRVLGVAGLVVGIILSGIQVAFLIAWPYGGFRAAEVALAVTCALFPTLAGSVLLIVIGRVVRLDTCMLALLESQNRSRKFEAPKSSSLPYIAPGSVLGALLGLRIAMEGLNRGELVEIALGFLFIVVGMLVGFASENVRVLLARMQLWGACLSGDPPRRSERMWDPMALWGLVIATGVALLALLSLSTDFRVSVLIGCTALLVMSIALLLSDLATSIRAWPPAPRRPKEVFLTAVVAISFAWSIFVSLLIFKVLSESNESEVVAMFAMWLICGGFGALLGCMALALAHGRRLQDAALGTLPQPVWHGMPALVALLLALSSVVNLLDWIWIVGVNMSRGSIAIQNLLIVCAILAMTGLPLWVLFIFREVLRAEASAALALSQARTLRPE